MRSFPGFERVADQLIRAGIDVNYTMSAGQTALLWAINLGEFIYICLYLLEACSSSAA